MTRGGHKIKSGAPERRCIASGESGPTKTMVRFVVGPDAEVIPDIAGKLPGRGIWVTSERSAIDLAVKKGLFSKAAKTKVKVADDLADQVEKLLRQRLTNTIAMARKAGIAICGLEKVKISLETGKAKLLLQASNGSERAKRELRPPNGEETRIQCLNSDELGLAFGRDNVIHAAIMPGGISKRVLLEANRLIGLQKVE
ncbi:MAG: RNA-binding protein [Rhodobacteraceae bacterium]|nr:RNA-binding protein [Paracoccaceae bacterium]